MTPYDTGWDQVSHRNLQMLDSADVMQLFRFSKSTLWRLVKDESFPEPIYVGRTPLWHENTLTSWLSEQHGLDVSKAAKKRDIDELC